MGIDGHIGSLQHPGIPLPRWSAQIGDQQMKRMGLGPLSLARRHRSDQRERVGADGCRQAPLVAGEVAPQDGGQAECEMPSAGA